MLKTTTKPTREATLPAFYVYHVIEGNEDRPDYWHRVGAVFPHGDQERGNIDLLSLPFNFRGRLVMRVPKRDDAK
ncbi:hypothetical protein [Variovorax ginsengisoli]|uniref:Uncharacterized protein n=1 Tax=Variovorax ginsengisoli TaxID=363844 RepID=A0ABT9SF17_9BURK|nr:hypothetical protein [Variovorax ginsengisoli]MDP9902954.1 hypothetical protein [Variovorax ginsengisoli]